MVNANEAAAEAEKSRKIAARRAAIDEAWIEGKQRFDEHRAEVTGKLPESKPDKTIREAMEDGQRRRDAETERLKRAADEEAESATDQGDDKWEWKNSVNDEQSAEEAARRLAAGEFEKQDDEV
jgi:hypothetical protein